MKLEGGQLGLALGAEYRREELSNPGETEVYLGNVIGVGYSSASAMYESADRIKSEGRDRVSVIFYLGDHDPSGEDMVRDIEDRLCEFGCEALTVRKIALTTEQVDKYKPPPNPAKLTDSRAAAYVRKHGASSWEVDALPPDVLAQLVRAAFEAIIDVDAMDEVKAREERDRARLQKAVSKLK
jgi:hypothetical protein